MSGARSRSRWGPDRGPRCSRDPCRGVRPRPIQNVRGRPKSAPPTSRRAIGCGTDPDGSWPLYGLSVPRLVLINGAPGSGKSTLAARYVEEHPLTLALDIDVVRSMLGGWLDQPTQAGLLARRLALAMAGAHLSSARDVVVPQFLGRLDFVLALEQLCADVGADFIEVALLSNPEDAARRFARRSVVPQSQAHRDAAALLERGGADDGLPQMYARLLDVVASRPATRIVVTVDGEIEQAYRHLVGHVDDPTTPTVDTDR